ncbi:MAG: hypothetical protein AAF385_07355 [Pseudomonadota bacterium]
MTPANATGASRAKLSADSVQKLSSALRLQTAMRLPYLASCSLAVLLAAPDAKALELGNAVVASHLGQPLRVEIPLRTSAGEQLNSDCISLVPGSRAALPAYLQSSKVTVTNNAIQISGSTAIREPLLGLNVRVNCKSTPHIVRSYQLFVDPAGLSESQAIASPARSNNSRALASETRPTATVRSVRRDAPTARAQGRSGDAIVQGQSYRVQRGDTLSGIAARISNRQTSLWATVDILHRANPQAFTNGDIDLLEQGRTLTIPLLQSATASTVLTHDPVASSNASARPEPVSTAPGSQSQVDAAFAQINTAPRQASLSATTTVDSELAEVTAATAAVESEIARVEQQIATLEEKFDVTSPFVLDEAANGATQAASSTNDADAPEVISHTAVVQSDSVEPEAESSGWSGWLLGLVAIAASAVLTLMLMLLMRRGSRREDVADFMEAPLPSPNSSVPEARRLDLGATDQFKATNTDLQWETQNENVVAAGTVSVEVDDSFSGTFDPFQVEEDSFSLGDDQNAQALDIAFDESSDSESVVDIDVGDATQQTNLDDSMMVPAPSIDESNVNARMTSNSPEDSNITIADLDLLAKDYEAEFTQTQQLNSELAEAVADLAKTKRERNAANDTAEHNIVPDDDTLHRESDIEAYGESDETAYFEESDLRAELKGSGDDTDQQWEDSTRANALQMSEDVLEDAATILSAKGDSEEETEMMPVGEHPTAEMPAAQMDPNDLDLDLKAFDETSLLDAPEEQTQEMPQEKRGKKPEIDSEEMWAELTGTNHRR